MTRNNSIYPRMLVLLTGLLWGCLLSEVHAENFVVTNSGNAGAGTLRDALERAASNGSGETDRILFDLPGESLEARTIRLNSRLPDISSNVIIDGTSQPGNAFGDSDAKVRIMPNPGVYGDQNDGALIVMNAANIEIY